MQTQNPENRARWKKIVQDQMTSGLTVSAFCINHSLKIQQFAYYKSVLFPKKKPSSSFIEVQSPKPVPKQASRILLNFKQVSLSFDADHDLETIVDLCLWLSAQE